MTKLLDKIGSFITKLRISKKVIATIFVVLFGISLIPIIITCFYSVPAADDYTFGYLTHKTLEDGGNYFQGVWSSASRFYMEWQGFYSSNFIASMQPYVFNVNLYWISNMVVIILIVFSFLYTGKTLIVNVMNGSVTDCILVTIPILTLFIQFMPSLAEGIYWMDGALSLAFLSIDVLMFAFIINYHSIKKKVYVVLALICAFLYSGRGLLSFVTVMLLLVLFLVYSIVKRYPVYKLLIIILVITLIGEIICIIAPGNSVRQAGVTSDYSLANFVKAVLRALYYSYAYFGKWTTLCYLSVILFGSVIFYNISQKSKHSFKNPLLVFIISYLIYAARMSVELFVAGTLGAPRQYNEYYWCFLFAITISIFYFVGWLSKRDIFSHKKYDAKQISAVFVLITAFVFGAGCFNYRIKSIASFDTALSLIKGETQLYNKEMKDRINIYETSTSKNLEVKPLTVYPDFFLSEGLSDDKNYWTNESIAQYYNLKSLKLK